MTVTPNTAGVADAMLRLRDALGVDATFLVRSEPAWPAGTPTDPDTGRPYDPFLDPVDPVSDTEVTVRVSFVHRPFVATSPDQAPIGNVDRGEAGLIVSEDDYPQVRAAHRVRVGEETWSIEQWRHDISIGFGRWLCFLEHA